MKHQELVERMCDAYNPDEYPTGFDTKRMTAALSVAMDAMLGPVTNEEWSRHAEYRKEVSLYLLGLGSLNDLLTCRRLRLTAKPIDPAVAAVSKILRDEKIMRGDTFDEAAVKIVSAVRGAQVQP